MVNYTVVCVLITQMKRSRTNTVGTYHKAAGISGSEGALALVQKLNPEEWNSVDKISAIKFRMENPVCLLMNQIAQAERLGIKTNDITNQTNIWRQQLLELRLTESIATAGDNLRRRLQIEIEFWERENEMHYDLPSLREQLKHLELSELRQAWLIGTEGDARFRLSREIQFLQEHVPDSSDLPVLQDRLMEIDRGEAQKLEESNANSRANQLRHQVEEAKLQLELNRLLPSSSSSSLSSLSSSSSSSSSESTITAVSSDVNMDINMNMNMNEETKETKKEAVSLMSLSAPSDTKRGGYGKAAHRSKWEHLTLAQVCSPWFDGARKNNRHSWLWQEEIAKEVQAQDPNIPLKYSPEGRLKITQAVLNNARKTLALLERCCRKPGLIPSPAKAKVEAEAEDFEDSDEEKDQTQSHGTEEEDPIPVLHLKQRLRNAHQQNKA